MDTSIISNLSAADLRRAAEIRDRIALLEDELSSILGGKGSKAPTKKRRGRKKKAGSAPVGRPAKKKKAKKKRKISAAGLAAIKAAQKRRWDAVKAKKGKKK